MAIGEERRGEVGVRVFVLFNEAAVAIGTEEVGGRGGRGGYGDGAIALIAEVEVATGDPVP